MAEHQAIVRWLETEYRVEVVIDPGVLLDCLTSLSNLTGRFGPEDQFRIEELSTHGWQIDYAEWFEADEVGGKDLILLTLVRTDREHAPGEATKPADLEDDGAPDPVALSS